MPSSLSGIVFNRFSTRAARVFFCILSEMKMCSLKVCRKQFVRDRYAIRVHSHGFVMFLSYWFLFSQFVCISSESSRWSGGSFFILRNFTIRLFSLSFAYLRATILDNHDRFIKITNHIIKRRLMMPQLIISNQNSFLRQPRYISIHGNN